jgi:DNA-binding beta-propeller fold protein YncE
MTAWDISTTVHLQNKSLTIVASLFIKSDGLKMYVIGNSDRVNEYDLSTAWDISSAAFLQVFSVNSEDINPQGLFFKPDGTKMYVSGRTSRNTNEYDLSTPWDITSATFLQLLDVSGKDTSPTALFFKPDGLKFYLLGDASNSIHEYDLSVAWDITSSTFLQTLSVVGQDASPKGLFFKPDGLKMYVTGSVQDKINEYDLSVAWDISSSTFLQLFSISQTPFSFGLFFKPDGSKFYVPDSAFNRVAEFDLPVPIAAFSGTPRKKKDSLTVLFDDESTNTPISTWSWKRRPSGIDASYVEFSTDENPSEDFDVTIP